MARYLSVQRCGNFVSPILTASYQEVVICKAYRCTSGSSRRIASPNGNDRSLVQSNFSRSRRDSKRPRLNPTALLSGGLYHAHTAVGESKPQLSADESCTVIAGRVSINSYRVAKFRSSKLAVTVMLFYRMNAATAWLLPMRTGCMVDAEVGSLALRSAQLRVEIRGRMCKRAVPRS